MDNETRRRLELALGPDAWATPPPLKNPEPEITIEDQLEQQRRLEFNQQLDSAVSDWGKPKPSLTEATIQQKAAESKQGRSETSANPGRPLARGAPLPESMLPKLLSMGFPDYNLAIGERASPKMTFTPWMMVTNYPEMFVGKGNYEAVAEVFNAESLFGIMSWDFFYIWEQPAKASKDAPQAVLFVPTEQVQRMLDITNATLQISSLKIPYGDNQRKFRVTFGEHGTPLPRFLGRVEGHEEFEAIKQTVPELNPEDSLEKVGDRASVLFRDKMEKIQKWHSRGKGNKKKSGKNKFSRIQKHLEWGRAMKRVQRYLGLRTHLSRFPVNFPKLGDHRIMKSLDMSRAMLSLPEDDAIFVCIDIELFEFNHSIVTEVGIATLDTRDTIGVPPGENCENWFGLIKARHLKVKGTEHLVNRVHVIGNEDDFNFGVSEVLEVAEVYEVVKGLLEQEPAAGFSPPPKETIFADEVKERRVVFVGHDAEQDILYLRKIGYEVMESAHLLEVVDTATLHQYHKRKMDSASLGAVCNDMSISFTHLHNGGNDAVYTLQAMIALAFKQREASIKLNNMIAAAPGKVTFKPDEDGWNSGGEWSDGGFPPTKDDLNEVVAQTNSLSEKLPRDYSKVKW